MKKNFFYKTLMTAALLIGFGHANIAAAHNQAGFVFATQGATDLFVVTCGAPASYLEAKVLDKSAGGPLMSVQIIKGAAAVNTSDLIGGDTTYSPFVKVTGGAGEYIMLLNHTGSLFELYDIEYHCMAANGTHATTTIVNLQNQ